MLSLHPAFPHFVSGAKNGKGSYFHCRVCKRDVGMKAQCSGEFARHFQADGHWFKGVTYRVHMGLPVLNRLMEPMELSEGQLAEYHSKAFEDLSEGYPFPEDLLPKHSRVESKVPFMTLVSCVCELLCSGGDFVLFRRLWSHFLLTLPKEKGPQFNLNWSRSETVVSMCLFVLYLFALRIILACGCFFLYQVSRVRGVLTVICLGISVPRLGSAGVTPHAE